MKNVLSKFFLIILLAGTSMLWEACTVAKLSGKGTVPIIMNQPQAKVTEVQKIEKSKQILFDYTGALDVSEVLNDAMVDKNIDAIINITVTIKNTPADFLLNLVTLGFANAKTFVVSGDAIRAPEGLSKIMGKDLEKVGDYKSIKDIKLPQGTIDGKTLVVKNKNGYSVYNYDY